MDSATLGAYQWAQTVLPAASKLAAPRTTMGDAFAKRNEHDRCRVRPLGLRSQRLYRLQHADDLVIRFFNHFTWQRGLVTRADRR
jgi:hypothetical protein